MKDDTKQKITEKSSEEKTNYSSEQETLKMNKKSSEEKNENDMKEVAANSSSEQPTQNTNEKSSKESIGVVSSIEETITFTDSSVPVGDMKDDTKQKITEKSSEEKTNYSSEQETLKMNKK